MGAEADHHLGGTAIKPKGYDRKGFEAFKYMLYNPETGEILTRTPLSWLLIFIFYVIYYGLLTCFWIASLQIFFLTLPEEQAGPRWTEAYSLIGINPGVGIRPAPTDKRIDSHLYFLKSQDTSFNATNDDGEGDENIDNAVRMFKFFKKTYEDDAGLQKDCANDLRKDGEPDCAFNVGAEEDEEESPLGECSQKNFPYGFVTEDKDTAVAPCLYFKLNKIWGWEPKPVGVADLETYPYTQMSQELKDIIKDADEKEDSNYIWIDCQGYKDADKEKFDVTYYPDNRGIPIKYFPYRGGHYQPPLVAIKFNRENPVETDGQLLHVECRAWYKGVKFNKKEKLGFLRYEILFEKKNETETAQA